MIGDADIRKCRAEVKAATADRWGCIRIRRDDVVAMLDLISAQTEVLDRLPAGKASPRFADRLRANGVLAKPARVRA